MTRRKRVNSGGRANACKYWGPEKRMNSGSLKSMFLDVQQGTDLKINEIVEIGPTLKRFND